MVTIRKKIVNVVFECPPKEKNERRFAKTITIKPNRFGIFGTRFFIDLISKSDIVGFLAH